MYLEILIFQLLFILYGLDVTAVIGLKTAHRVNAIPNANAIANVKNNLQCQHVKTTWKSLSKFHQQTTGAGTTDL